MLTSQDKQWIVEQYEKGKTLQSIGNNFEISRQRVWQIVKEIGATNHINTENRDIRKRRRIDPRNTEKHIYKKLARKGFKVEYQPYNHPFDLLVNKKRVEVKYLRNSRKIYNQETYHFTDLYTSIPIDFFVFICGYFVEKPIYYIVEAENVKGTFYIPQKPKSKKTKEKEKMYRNRWDKLR